MLRTNMEKIIGLVRINLMSYGRYKAGENAVLPYYLNIFLPVLTFVMAGLGFFYPLGSRLSVLFLVFFIINNVGFFSFLLLKRGPLFACAGLGILFIEYFFVFFSILYAVPYSYLSLNKDAH